MRYESLNHYTKEEIEEIMSSNDEKKISLLPLSIGEYHDDLAFAQKFCLKLLETGYNDEIRANAVLGLSYLARRFQQLDKAIMPCLQVELEKNETFNDRVEYSIEDIRIFMGW
jgi:predicted urease superfamily metal-dependent hydrolase